MAIFTTLGELPGLEGTVFDPSPWCLIDDDMILAFAHLTSDRQWIHIDRARTEAAGHGLVAHGYLLLSLLPCLSDPMLVISDCARALNYGLDKVRLIATVFSGTRVRLIRELLSVRAHRSGLLVTNRYVLEREGEASPAMVADTLVLYQ